MIRLLVCDFDGCMTDNHVYVDAVGNESVRCSRADGIGIEKVKALGIDVAVITNELGTTPAVARCHKLGIKCIQTEDKLGALMLLAMDAHIDLKDVAYVGNDDNDLPCLKAVGYPWVVWDSSRSLEKQFSDLKFMIEPYGNPFPGLISLDPQKISVTKAKGGDGAVREVWEWIVAQCST